MERFLSLGWKARPKVEAPQPKAKGRPKATAVEGALDLGEKRPRVCGSKKVVIDEQSGRRWRGALSYWKHCRVQMRRCRKS